MAACYRRLFEKKNCEKEKEEKMYLMFLFKENKSSEQIIVTGHTVCAFNRNVTDRVGIQKMKIKQFYKVSVRECTFLPVKYMYFL